MICLDLEMAGSSSYTSSWGVANSLFERDSIKKTSDGASGKKDKNGSLRMIMYWEESVSHVLAKVHS